MRQTLISLTLALASIWGVSLYALTDSATLYSLALIPRTMEGLNGILTMPLVHVSLVHLSTNTPLFIVLAALVHLRGLAYYLRATALIVLLGGGALWLVGREAAHVGASGLVFGYFGLLVSVGVFERRIGSVLLSLCVAGAYAGLLFGMLPSDETVSWDGHTAGFISGIITARLLAQHPKIDNPSS